LIEPASLPDDGSVKQNAANSLLDTLGRYLAFCSGVPNNNIPCKWSIFRFTSKES